MASLTSLPSELLLAIYDYLNLFELEAVAQTFNRTLYFSSYPLIAPRLQWLQHVKRVRDIFAPAGSLVEESEDGSQAESMKTFPDDRPLPRFPGYFPTLNSFLDHGLLRLPVDLAEKLGLDGGWETFYTNSSPPDLRSWMKLDGSFEWLKPLPETVQEAMSHHHPAFKESVATLEAVDLLNCQASELGISLPPGFDTFFLSDELHYRLPSSMAWYFELDPKFTKCPPIVDHGNGGYLLRFHIDQQGCAFSYLYLDQHGGSCVLVSAYGFDEDESASENSEEEGDTVDGDLQADISANSPARATPPISSSESEPSEEQETHVVLRSLTFEEYLVSTYFEEMLWFLAHEFSFDPPQGLKDYVKHAWLPVSLKDREARNQGYHAGCGSEAGYYEVDAEDVSEVGSEESK